MVSLLSNVLFLEGSFFVGLFLYSLLKQENKFAIIFSIMCLAIAVYVIGYGFELRSHNVEEIKFFLKTEYFGLTFAIPFGMMLAYKFYFNKNQSLKLRIGFLFIPMLTLFFSSTNEYHNLFYTKVSTIQYGEFLLVDLEKAPWYFVNIIYSYTALLFGGIVFFFSWRSSKYKLKTQAFWLFCGSICPGIVNIPYIAGVSPWKIDLTPFGFGLLAVAYSIAIFCYDFLEIKEKISNFTFSHISEGIIVVDDKNRLVEFNNAAYKIFDSLDIGYIGKDFSYFWRGKKIIRQEDEDCYEIEIKKEDQQKYYEFRTAELKENTKLLGFVYFIKDITNQKEMIEKLNSLANYDVLTEIYNRRRLMEEAEKELNKARTYKNCISVLMIDIDHFKKVNDKYGHLAGDEVIKTITKACKDNLRRDDIIGRYGGEEFIIILPNTDKKDAIKIAERIRLYINELIIEFNQEKISVTVSIGAVCAIIKNDKINIEKIINEADKGLYYAKNHGRNQLCACEI